MNLHEYQAKSLLAGMGMPCPKEIAIQQISQLDYPVAGVFPYTHTG